MSLSNLFGELFSQVYQHITGVYARFLVIFLQTHNKTRIIDMHCRYAMEQISPCERAFVVKAS